MAQTIPKAPNYNPRRINRYVPGLQYAADVQPSGIYEAYIGKYRALDATAILSGQSIATASSTTTFVADTLTDAEAPYGRAVNVIASGAATSTVTIKGRDYLGQPMVETITLTGATDAPGAKAFKYIDVISWGATAATTINVGWTTKLGLPYTTNKVLAETSLTATGGTLVAETVGTLAQPILATPTATTGDPRGTYIVGANGAGEQVFITAIAMFVDASAMSQDDVAVGLAAIDDAVGGGLYGLRHYYA